MSEEYKAYESIMFQKNLGVANRTGNYKSVIMKIRINHKVFSKNTYSLICDICENNVINFMLIYPVTCSLWLSVNTNELRKLLACNGYDEKHDCFKIEENAKEVADYINACILLQQLKM